MLNRKSGVLVHPTSFPSKYGIGDLGKEAYDFIDFLAKSSQSLWQILPFGPTSFGDSPYQSFSTFAGNELLISPELLQENDLINSIPENTFPRKVQYGEVIKYKMDIFRQASKNFDFSDLNFIEFKKDNAPWLDDYCLFRALKNYHIEMRKLQFEPKELIDFRKEYKEVLTIDQCNDYYYGGMWITWDNDIKYRKRAAILNWTSKLKIEIQFYEFMQYMFYKQWINLKTYANEKNIKIIGDIPIFVSFDSSDAWSNPSLFFLDEKFYPTKVAGVPPDYFSKTGQLWGNPLYKWSAHKKSKYSWWKKRVSHSLNLVDILRIDHFRGFDTYWAVPAIEKTAINGEWEKGPGSDLFNELIRDLGNLPIIAEDLGEITDDVIALRDEFSLPGMKILQFAFNDDYSLDYLSHNYENTNSVCYTGTHDNDTTIGWYNSLTEKEKDLVRKYLNISGDDIAWDFIRLCFSTISKMAIIPIQDLLMLNEDYRMNTPGTPQDNWQFRYKIEDLSDDVVSGLLYLNLLYNRNNKNEEI